MSVDNPLFWKRLLARLSATGALFGVLLAGVLLLLLDDLRWGTFVLALVTALTGISAVLQISAVRAMAQSSKPKTPEPPEVRQETNLGLPVHPTTGLYRPWVFRQRFIEEMERARRHKHDLALVLLEPADLLMEVGPEMYARAARALRKALRVCDFAAQLDDERFAVLLPETDKEGAKAAGRRLLSSLGASSERGLCWRASLVTYPEDSSYPASLLEQALIALRRSRVESATGPGSEAAA